MTSCVAGAVLLVEDDELVRAVLTDMLDEMGHDVLAFSSAEAALQDPAPFRGEAVLVTDLDLGAGMDGFALAGRAQQLCPGMGVVYITGGTRRVPSSLLGAHERFIVKPFPLGRLLEALQELAERSGPQSRVGSRPRAG
jgi:FixJ family two-component response regulator